MSVAAYFTASGPGRYEPSDHVRGPWSRDVMHAGPPSALIAHVMAATGEGIPDPGIFARFAVEILRPVPVTEVRVEAGVVRPGRRVALLEGVLSVGEEPVMLARAWLVRTGQVAVPHTPVEPAPESAGTPRELPPWWGRGYLDSIEWGWVSGSFEEPGAATVWTRAKAPLVAGHATRPVERVLLVVDSGSGISAVASPRELLFVNTDLTLHLHRAPVGERIWMRSQTTVDHSGVGVASTVVGDERGSVGHSLQSLFVAPRE